MNCFFSIQSDFSRCKPIILFSCLKVFSRLVGLWTQTCLFHCPWSSPEACHVTIISYQMYQDNSHPCTSPRPPWTIFTHYLIPMEFSFVCLNLSVGLLRKSMSEPSSKMSPSVFLFVTPMSYICLQSSRDCPFHPLLFLLDGTEWVFSTLWANGRHYLASQYGLQGPRYLGHPLLLY